MSLSLTRYIPNAITLRAGKAALQLQKSSPTVLFSTGVVGVVATTVLASRATLKLEAVLDESTSKLDAANALISADHPDYSQADYRRDTIIIRTQTAISISKLYAVPLAVGTVSIACLVGSHFILSSRNVALTAAYAAVDKAFREYRGRVLEEVGYEKERDLYHGVSEVERQSVTKKGKEVRTVEKRSDGKSMYARWFSSQTSSNWNSEPEYNFMFLRCQQKEATRVLHSKGFITLNDVYDLLGLERTQFGMVVGWVRGNGDDYVDFGVFDNHLSLEVVDFFSGNEEGIWLDFNVDGNIYDLI